MKLRRLWQPGRMLFWLMIAFNVFSSLFSYAMRALPLNSLGLVLAGSLALVNVAGGLWAAWQLVRDPPLAQATTSPDPAPDLAFNAAPDQHKANSPGPGG
jgi:hypothetical protein